MKKNIFFFIILFTPLINTLYAMELTDSTQQTKKNRRKSALKKNAFKRKSKRYENSIITDEQKQPILTKKITFEPRALPTNNDLSEGNNNHYTYDEAPLLWAARNNNTKLIKELLKYDATEVNQVDHSNQTALHYMAQEKNEEIIHLLLRKPQLDASLFNNNRKTAREMIVGNSDNDQQLRLMIFARIMLNLTVKKVCSSLQDHYKYACHISTIDPNEDPQEVIKNALKAIKESLTNDHANQKEDDRNLPDSAKLPDYANDDFIKEMIILQFTKGSA